MRFLRALLTRRLINLEGARMGDPTAFRSSRRLTFFIITFEAVVLVAVTYLRSQHYHFKGLPRMSQVLVAPLRLLRLINLMFRAQLCHWFAFESLQHNGGFGLRIPLSSLHG